MLTLVALPQLLPWLRGRVSYVENSDPSTFLWRASSQKSQKCLFVCLLSSLLMSPSCLLGLVKTTVVNTTLPGQGWRRPAFRRLFNRVLGVLFISCSPLWDTSVLSQGRVWETVLNNRWYVSWAGLDEGSLLHSRWFMSWQQLDPSTLSQFFGLMSFVLFVSLCLGGVM